MVRVKLPGFALSLTIFLNIILLSGCLSLKTVPTRDISYLPVPRKYIKLHYEDKSLILEKYSVQNGLLSGALVKNSSGVTKLRTIDIYIGGINNVRIDNDLVTVSSEAIGKIDYEVVDGLKVLSGVCIFFVFMIFSPVFIR